VNPWPYLVVFVLLGAFMLISVRNRRRQVAADAVRVSRIGVGSEVMTTSGLYGTVVAKHDDGTVLLAIAPGVEVTWAAAALRDAASLAQNYRRALDSGARSDGGRAGSGSDAADPGQGADLRKHGDDDAGS
jgi:preprotein translocase subunit YajC